MGGERRCGGAGEIHRPIVRHRHIEFTRITPIKPCLSLSCFRNETVFGPNGYQLPVYSRIERHGLND
jgi:hypothetical protein